MTSRAVAPAASIRGSLRVPGDKSTSHRAVLLSALADGASVVRGISSGDDVRASTAIIVQLGARVRVDAGTVHVEGPSGGLHASAEPLACANSGTTMRLVAGVASTIAGTHVLVGDASLSRRPMDRVATPLTLMGAEVRGHGERACAPLTVRGSSSLRAIEYHVPVPSAQVKSAILLAGLSAGGHTVVSEDVRTRATTEDMLVHAGLTVHSVDAGAGRTVTLTPGRPRAREWVVPADPSQAAFFLVLATVHPHAEIELRDVGVAPERVGFLQVLTRMGASVTSEETELGVTWRATSAGLRATQVHAGEVPSVDEVPILTVAAAAAEGVTVFRDVGELRVKESDRFNGSMQLARALGCRAWAEGDDLFIEGLGSAGAFEPLVLDARLDHRMAMAAAVAMTAGAGGVIEGSDTVASSYPDFFTDLASLT